jgi:hypothetical protein
VQNNGSTSVEQYSFSIPSKNLNMGWCANVAESWARGPIVPAGLYLAKVAHQVEPGGAQVSWRCQRLGFEYPVLVGEAAPGV